MKNLTLKMKLGLGFGSLLLIITILGVTGYESAVTAADGSEQAEAQVRKSELAGRLETATEKQVAAARAFLLTGSEEHLKSGEIARDSFDNDTKELGKAPQHSARSGSFGRYPARLSRISPPPRSCHPVAPRR